MPIYGKAKTKTMLRSILPSSGRKVAKKRKDNLHRYNRRIANNRLHNYKGYVDDLEEYYDDDNYDYNLWLEPHNSSIDDWDDIVYDRRGKDKLAHFETWAYLKTLHLPPEDRFDKIASMVSGVLGTHAMSHLEFLKYDPLERNTWHDHLPRQYRQNRYVNQYLSNQKRIRIQLTAAVSAIAHDKKKRDAFNAYMIKNASLDIEDVYVYNYDHLESIYHYRKALSQQILHKGARTLNGYHDVTRFINDIYAAQKVDPKLGYHPSWIKFAKQYFNVNDDST